MHHSLKDGKNVSGSSVRNLELIWEERYAVIQMKQLF